MSILDPAFLKHLSSNSAHYRDPLTVLPWHALSLQDFWLPPTALSLAGVPKFEAQPTLLQQRLSQYEFMHFIQAGLWLEGIFIARLGGGLQQTAAQDELAYNLHEIREEAGHSLMFLKLMEQSALYLPSSAFRRPWLAQVLSRYATERSSLFWLAAVIGEEIPDWLNRLVQKQSAEVNPLIAQMCRLHIIDEARHIARSRRSLDHRLAELPAWRRRLLKPIANTLLRQFVRTFYLPSPEIYELAGLSPGRRWQHLALHNPSRQALIAQCTQPTLQRLAQSGLVLTPVQL